MQLQDQHQETTEQSNMRNSYSEAPLVALRYGCTERYDGLILVHLLNANA